MDESEARIPMHFSWSQHLELARAVSTAADNDKGTALALMGVGLTLLMRDLEQSVPGRQVFTRSSLSERA
tara:strand:+ start:342 stop:551 length:210 start_codon:yes stop_codon:yes gene_type:complete